MKDAFPLYMKLQRVFRFLENKQNCFEKFLECFTQYVIKNGKETKGLKSGLTKNGT